MVRLVVELEQAACPRTGCFLGGPQLKRGECVRFGGGGGGGGGRVC